MAFRLTVRHGLVVANTHHSHVSSNDSDGDDDIHNNTDIELHCATPMLQAERVIEASKIWFNRDSNNNDSGNNGRLSRRVRIQRMLEETWEAKKNKGDDNTSNGLHEDVYLFLQDALYFHDCNDDDGNDHHNQDRINDDDHHDRIDDDVNLTIQICGNDPIIVGDATKAILQVYHNNDDNDYVSGGGSDNDDKRGSTTNTTSCDPKRRKRRRRTTTRKRLVGIDLNLGW